jgi:hypothetical protein
MTLANNGQRNIFLAKYDTYGNAVNAESIGGSDIDDGISIATDPSGDIVLTGYITSNSVSFGSITLTSGGMFVAKSSALTGIASLNNEMHILAFPNPTNNVVTVSLSLNTPQYFNLYLSNSLGQVLQTFNLNAEGKTEKNIDLSSYPSGIYFIYLKSEKIIDVIKVLLTK